MYSTVRVMEHGGRLATLSECPIHLSSCDDEEEDGDVVHDDNDDVYFGDGNDEGDDFEGKKGIDDEEDLILPF